MLKAQTKTTCDRKEGIVNPAFCEDMQQILRKQQLLRRALCKPERKQMVSLSAALLL